MPLPPAEVMKEFNLDQSSWRVLVDQLFPTAKEPASVIMALSYCKARKLDIFKKPVHIVPMYSSALKRMVETCWPSISEIRTTATRTGEYAGIDEVKFGPMIEGEFSGEVERWVDRKKTVKNVTKKVRYPEWASVVVYRWVKGHKAAFHTKIYWTETYGTLSKTKIPNDMWEKRPIGQFDKCLEAAALRKAFPEEVGSMYAAEEMEGRDFDSGGEHVASARNAAAPAPDPDEPTETATRGDVVDVEGEEIDDEAGETDQDEAADSGSDAPDPGDDEPSSGPDNTDEWGDDHERYFADLRDAMSEAQDETDVEEAWTRADPEGRYDGQDHYLTMAIAVKDMRLKKLAAGKKGGK